MEGTVYLDLDGDGKRGAREPGIAGVAVSNGREVAVTDGEGHYELPDTCEGPASTDDQVWCDGPIWVSVPTGHRSSGPFYRSAEDPVLDFGLVEEKQPDDFTFVYYTDLHLGEGVRGAERLAETLAEIATLQPTPRFCIDGGDITLQGDCGERYRAILDRFPLPVRHSMGNHEHLVDNADPKRGYRDLFGPTYYSFNYGGTHFLILDAMKIELTGKGWRNVVGEMGGVELAWLEADLAHVGPGAPIVIVSHIALWTTFDERRGVGRYGEPAWLVMNYETVLRALRPYNVQLVLQGHLHENEHHWEHGIHFLTTGSVCGSWWDQSDDPLCPDGTPKGYRIVRVAGNQITSVYKSTGKPIDYQLRIDTPAEGGPVGDSFAVEVNVFDGSNHTEVLFQIDDGPWHPMHLEPSFLTDTSRACAHRWIGQVQTASATTRIYCLKVKATDSAWGTLTAERKLTRQGS